MKQYNFIFAYLFHIGLVPILFCGLVNYIFGIIMEIITIFVSLVSTEAGRGAAARGVTVKSIGGAICRNLIVLTSCAHAQQLC